MSFYTAGSENYLFYKLNIKYKNLPINLLVAKTVFSGFVTAYLLAGIPTNFYPSDVNDTIDGVVLNPSWFSITLATDPSMTATQELVVPKSIPII